MGMHECQIVGLCLCDKCVRRLERIFKDRLKVKGFFEGKKTCEDKECFLCSKVTHEDKHYIDIGF